MSVTRADEIKQRGKQVKKLIDAPVINDDRC